MTACPHAETTALLHLFGEAPPSYAAHLIDCVECQASLAEHSDTVARVEPALRPAPRSTLQAAPRRATVWGFGAALALAAGLALSLLPGPLPTAAQEVRTEVLDLTWYDPMSTELSWIEEDIAALSADLLSDPLPTLETP